MNLQTLQPGFWREQAVSEYTILPAIERLFGRRPTPEMIAKYRYCRTIEELFDTICRDDFTQALLMGDQGIGALTEMYIAMRSDTRWEPMDGLDTWGAKLDRDTLEAKGIRIQVRHSKQYQKNAWSFRTKDTIGQRRYDVLACVGYPPPEVTCMRVTYLNPTVAKVFLVPVSALGTKEEIYISRQAMHMQASWRRLEWWEYNVPDHTDIDECVKNLAHGKPIRLDSQLSLWD